MEEDSLEDGALKAYFEEADRKRQSKKKKREEEKRAAREQGKGGDEGGQNREGESTEDRNDSSQLTHLNPSCVRTTQKNQTAIAHLNRFQSLENVSSETDSGSDSSFPPSRTTRTSKSQITDLDDDEEFLDDLGFDTSPIDTSPPPLASLQGDFEMNEEVSSNQAESNLTGQDSDAPQEEGSNSQIHSEHITQEGREESTSPAQVSIQEGEGGSKSGQILTVESFNQIVRKTGRGAPLHQYKSQPEFFRSKEENYIKQMASFQNGDGSYNISHSVALAVALALETEQRNKNYVYHQNEFQMLHLRNVLEITDFTKQIRDSVTKRVTEHIINKLNGPVEQSQAQLEAYSKTVIKKLEEHAAMLDDQREHRMERGFLSKTRDEHEAEVTTYKLTALKEDNENLTSERDELEVNLRLAKKHNEKLKVEKKAWQDKYLELLKGDKRPRDEPAVSSEKKHKPDAPVQESSSASPPPAPAVMSNSEHRNSSHRNSEHRISEHRTSDHRNSEHRTSSSHGEPSAEIKRALRNELNLNFNPWQDYLSEDDKAAVTIALWKRELRKLERYVPDYCTEKMGKYRLDHDRNIKFCMSAFENFRSQSGKNKQYSYWVEDKHLVYERLQARNHIPMKTGDYKSIINDPGTAAFVRCVPVDLYYYEVARDSKGFKPRVQNRDEEKWRHTHTSKSQGTSHIRAEAEQEVDLSCQSENHDAQCTWLGETIGAGEPRSYRQELLSLEEIEEVRRLDELVRKIRTKWPPGYYVAMRNQDITKVKAIHTQGQEVPKWAENLTAAEISEQNPQARQRYDEYQISLIHARVVRITNTAAVTGKEPIIDGPGGQGPV